MCWSEQYVIHRAYSKSDFSRFRFPGHLVFVWLEPTPMETSYFASVGYFLGHTALFVTLPNFKEVLFGLTCQLNLHLMMSLYMRLSSTEWTASSCQLPMQCLCLFDLFTYLPTRYHQRNQGRLYIQVLFFGFVDVASGTLILLLFRLLLFRCIVQCYYKELWS